MKESLMHYPVHPLLDPRTRATLAAELAQAARNPKLCPLMERAPDLWPGLVRSYLHLARLPRKLRRQLATPVEALARRARAAPGPGPGAGLGGDHRCHHHQPQHRRRQRLLPHRGHRPNANATPPLAAADCAAGDAGADTINLRARVGTHTLTVVNNSTYGATGLPVVSTPITIEGNGSTINRDQQPRTPSASSPSTARET